MGKLSTRIGNSPNKLVKHLNDALSPFTYEDGYTFSATDLGKLGVKIELKHKHDTGGAIILPPQQVGECGRWFLDTLEQESNGLPKGLHGILERLSKQSGFRPKLQRGDKKKIKDALRAFKIQSSKRRTRKSALQQFPKKAI